MAWTWLDIVIVALGVFLAGALVWLFLTLLRLRRSASAFARRATSGKDPAMRLAHYARVRGVRLGG